LVSTAKHDTHPADVAALAGRRLVLLHETNRGAKFNGSKIKRLTGGDKLTAHYMRENWFEFSPTHTLFLLSNYKPQGDGGDRALWDRIKLVPFTVTIPEEDRDTELTEKIRAELPGVLAWLVRGHTAWLEAGSLRVPSVIQQQTAEYRAAEDVIGRFIEERCIVSKYATAQAGPLFAAFKKWCTDQGEEHGRANEFSTDLIGRGFLRRSKSNRVVYVGINLNPEERDEL
jgi:putative DNA primase/helicase